MSAQWKIEITSPNGTRSNFVIDGDMDDAALRDFIEQTLAIHRENDHTALEGTAGVPPMVQPRKQAVSDKR